MIDIEDIFFGTKSILYRRSSSHPTSFPISIRTTNLDFIVECFMHICYQDLKKTKTKKTKNEHFLRVNTQLKLNFLSLMLDILDIQLISVNPSNIIGNLEYYRPNFFLNN